MKAKLKLKLERPEGVNEGDGTLSVHPCHALLVAENDESRSPSTDSLAPITLSAASVDG